MAGLLSDRGWAVNVVTGTALGSLPEIDEGFSVSRSTALRTLFRRFSVADVVIINGGVSIHAGLVASLVRKPFVVWHQMAGPLRGGVGIAGSCRNRIEAWLCRSASVHVGVSNACLASKHLPVGVRSEVIFNPVSKALEQKSRPDHETKLIPVDILYVGRLIEGKGLLVLAEALGKLSQHVSKVSIAVVGDGPLRERLEADLKSIRGLRPTFTGALAASELAEWYARARCLVLPSTTHPEGMPLVIGEAQTFGVPVVASDQPANVEAVADAGVIAPMGNVGRLAEALHLILTDIDQHNRFQANALRLASRYSSSRFGDQVENLIRSLLFQGISNCKQ